MTLRRALSDHTDLLYSDAPNQFAIPWWLFLSLRGAIGQIRNVYNVDVIISAEAERRLSIAQVQHRQYQTAEKALPMAQEQVLAELKTAGFVRNLTPEQLRNISHLANLPAGATFSVPGAGKTTEALGYFAIRAKLGDRLLVVAPKNAFTAWEEQMSECFGTTKGTFTRLRGGETSISQLLESDPSLMLRLQWQLHPCRASVQDIVDRARLSKLGSW